MDTQQAHHDDLKAHLTDTNIWKRLLWMILFSVVYSVAEVVIAVVVVYQFLSLLISGSKNEKVLSFGAQLASYAYQIFSYLTFNSEARPYPVGDWPGDKPLSETVEKAEEPAKPKRAPRKRTVRKEPAKKVEPEETPSTEENPTQS